MDGVLLVADLLNNPENFDDSVVTVVGLFVRRLEHCAIHPSSGETRSLAQSVWLNNVEMMGGRPRVSRMSGNWVRVTGVFQNQSGGHRGSFPAVISQITALDTHAKHAIFQR